MVIYERFGLDSRMGRRCSKTYIYKNKPGYVNVAIVMYSRVEDYEKFFGSVFNSKIIHLLRNPGNTARSCLQKRANRACYGASYKSRRKLHEQLTPNAPIDMKEVETLSIKIADTQNKYMALLKTHPDIFTVYYDDITNNAQVNEVPEIFCASILKFLCLPYHPLTNDLQKVIKDTA